jgi:hypothetical protein
MPNSDNEDKSSLKNSALNRRNILLGGSVRTICSRTTR